MSLKGRLDFALASYSPRLYCRLLGLRSQVNREKQLFLALLERGEVVFDIGANAGSYTLLFSHRVGPPGRVHAFEPVPPTVLALRKHLAAEQRFDNVTVHPSALAEKTGEAEVVVPADDPGQASLGRHQQGSWKNAATLTPYHVRVERLDDLLAAGTLPAPTFLKIDVEGAELPVLRGAQATLERHRPTVYAEVFPGWTESFGYHPAEVAALLRSHGYRRFFLLGDQLRVLAEPEAELRQLTLSPATNLLALGLAHQTPRHLSRLARLKRA